MFWTYPQGRTLVLMNSKKLIGSQSIIGFFRLLSITCFVFWMVRAPYLQEGITKSSRIHTHSTRSGTLALFKPRMGTHGQKTFLFKGISLWNSLPSSVQSQQCKDIFKLEVKKHFLVNFQKLKMQCIFSINQAGPDSLFMMFLIFFNVLLCKLLRYAGSWVVFYW